MDAGRPFSGPSGMLLDHLLEMYGVERDDVLTTNVVLCKTDKPPKEAIEACKPRLVRELQQAETILCAGAEAAKLIIGKTLKASRGQRIMHRRHDGRTVQLVSTFNPAAALRDDVYYPGLVQDFKRACTAIPPAFSEPTVHVAYDLLTAAAYLDELREEPAVAIDIETSGLDYNSDLVSIGFAAHIDYAYVLSREVCYSHRGKELLRQWFTDMRPQGNKESLGGLLGQTHIYHNGQFDTQILRYHGIPAWVDEDTLHLSNVCDERPGTHSLDYLVQNELEWPDYTPAPIKLGKSTGWRTYGKDGDPFYHWRTMYQYNGTDAIALQHLWPLLTERMRAQGREAEHANERTPEEYYRRVRIPAVNAYARVEMRGVPFDSEKARELNETVVLPKLQEMKNYADLHVKETLQENIGATIEKDVHINLNSPKQTGNYIYSVLGATDFMLNRGDDGRPKRGSVDAQHRERILEEHLTDHSITTFVENLDSFKRLDKTRSTYLEPLARLVDADGRMRCDILLHGAETGRTSAQKPNLQNQPRTSDSDIDRGEGWVNIRQLYYAPPGYSIVQADYSQLELRTAAVLSQDPGLLNIFLEGRDLHSEVARQFYGEQFTKQQRVLAKNVNFGILFGLQAKKLARMQKLPFLDAQEAIDLWWTTFPRVGKWVAEVHDKAKTVGVLPSPWGHRRRFHLITPQNIDHTLKEAVNFYVQGTAAQFTTLAVVELEPILSQLLPDSDRNGVVLTVHDSILALVPDSRRDAACRIIKHTMETIPARYLNWTQIPFKVDVQYGRDWGHLDHDYEDREVAA